MVIIDSRVGIWEGSAVRPHQRQTATFSKDDLLKGMDDAGIDAAVIHPSGSLNNANEIAVAAAHQHPDRLGVFDHFPIDQPKGRALLDRRKQRPETLGLHLAFNQAHQRHWWTDGTLDRLWSSAERAGLPISLDAPGQMTQVARVAERHPQLRLIIAHMGRTPGTKDSQAFTDLVELAGLAKYGNVAVEASGAPSYSSEPYPYGNIHRYIHQIYDAFGPNRMFWGSDITRVPCSYRECVTMFTEELPWLRGDDKDLVMGLALSDWIQLPERIQARLPGHVIKKP